MASQYAQQLIVTFLNGKNDDVIDRGAFSLVTKFMESRGLFTPIVTVKKSAPLPTEELKQCIEELAGRHTRIYLFGHGSLGSQTMGGFSLQDVAGFLKQAWPETIKVFRVSLISCRMAGVPKQKVGVKDCVRSFAGQLFIELGANRVASMTARVHSAMIVDKEARLEGKPLWRPVHGMPGQKRVALTTSKLVAEQVEASVSHHVKTKVLFSWKQGVARSRFYDYGKPKFKLADLPREDIAGLEDDYVDGSHPVDPNLMF